MTLAHASTNAFDSTELRRHADTHSSDEVVILRAAAGPDEWGIVVLDFESGDDDEAILVEIFVLRDRRTAGLGSQTLKCAEDLARERTKANVA